MNKNWKQYRLLPECHRNEFSKTQALSANLETSYFSEQQQLICTYDTTPSTNPNQKPLQIKKKVLYTLMVTKAQT